MDTDSQFVFSGRGGDESGRGTENINEDYVPTEIHVRSGSKQIRKQIDTHNFTSKNESIMEESAPHESRMNSRSQLTISQIQGKAPG